MPSVVNIATSRRKTIIEQWNDRLSGGGTSPFSYQTLNGVGSGVILEQVGTEVYVLTTLHVVDSEDTTGIQVQLSNGRAYQAKPVLGQKLTDLMLLKIILQPDDPPVKGVQFAKDDDLLLGETVIAVGNPYGFGGSVSRGILSSKNRRSMSLSQPLSYPDWLQTDADINPGNSGGALVNLRGELIGINVALYEGREGTGLKFAIPVKQIASALSDFFTLEWTSKLWFGARFHGTQLPVTVRDVQKGSPADRAGLRVGQEILQVNGQQVAGLVALNSLMASNSKHRASLTVSDEGRQKKLEVELLPLMDLIRMLLREKLGLVTTELTAQQAASFQIAQEDALLVTEIETNSPAQSAALEPGLVVTAVGGSLIGVPATAAPALGKTKPGTPLTLSLLVPGHIPGGVQLQKGSVTLPVR